MGRITYLSIPERYRPLSKRINCVLSNSTKSIHKEVHVFDNLNDALEFYEKDETIENVFVIGGGQVYQTAINDKRCNKIYLTLITEDIECDTFFPQIPKDFEIKECIPMIEENGLHFQFSIYQRKDLLI